MREKSVTDYKHLCAQVYCRIPPRDSFSVPKVICRDIFLNIVVTYRLMHDCASRYVVVLVGVIMRNR